LRDRCSRRCYGHTYRSLHTLLAFLHAILSSSRFLSPTLQNKEFVGKETLSGIVILKTITPTLHRGRFHCRDNSSSAFLSVVR